MREAFRWLSPEEESGGVLERPFLLSNAGRDVPGICWQNGKSTGAAGTVLLAHGGSGHKRIARTVRMARWLVRHAGLVAVAVDGPYHGDRVPEPVPPEVYQARIVREGVAAVTDRLVEEWLGTVDALAAEGVAGAADIGYFGLSMGARYGIPLAAALGPRLRCLVVGKFGMEESPLFDPGLRQPERLLRELRRIQAPTLFHAQIDDELFPYRGQRRLFDELGSTEKEFAAYPGPHHRDIPEAEERWLTFLAGHLRT